MSLAVVAVAVLDIEASGFGRGSYPIEIGFVLADGVSHCVMIKPSSDWVHWTKEAEALHGISRETLRTKGRSVRQVADYLNEQLEGLCLYSDAWGNDSSWLALLFEVAGVAMHFKIESLATIMSPAQKALWHDVKCQLQQQSLSPRHRASNDACIIQQTWLRTAELTNID